MVLKLFETFKRLFQSPWLYRLIRFAIASVFIYAGFIKLISPKAFAHVIAQYNIAPDALLAPLAVALPAIELLAGIGLLLNVRGSLSVIFGLLALFSSVLGYAILNNLNIDCGCLSVEEIRGLNNLRQAFYRDLAMMGAVLILFFRSSYCLTQATRSDILTRIIKRRNLDDV